MTELWRSAEATGFHFIAAQAAEVLGRSMSAGGKAYLERAAALRATLGFVNMANWFARQESWQRQLAALTSLHDAAGSGAAEAQTRLVWDIAVEAAYVSVAPREQKRSKATGQWTSGRAVSLKRLREDYAEMDFLTLQDRRVCAEIKLHHSRSYYGSEYRLDGKKAFVHLIDHPLVFWQHSPAIRVEVLRGKPELTVTKAAGDSYTLRLQPPFAGDARILIAKETPTRVRVVEIADEHRQIAAVIGDGLCVPAHAKDLILEAIEAISAVITVQSDLDVLPPNVEQVAADGRLHVHLLPYDDGLKLQFKVRPFATDGPYYSPGVGAECVIAEVAGKSVQARRNPAEETRAVNRLFSTCPALNDAIEHFGEWIVADPAQCLELLLQLQAQADADVDVIVLAWPEGEKFRVAREVGAANFSLSIKRHQDWFAAEGELRVDDALVIDLRQLLESLAQAPGRFLPLGGNRFMALTAEFRRRLEELRVFADSHANGVRVHALASGALEDMADAAGKLKADKHWKEHLARLRELDTLAPQLPGALQAELRDYQVSGYNWLSRLAHWGVGACLADDMGLGKTLQALALLLARAADGPALVVAPTSVCMNWSSEAARFAPTLNVILFGAGDRQQTLAELKPFDLLVVSYGLLQQEAERFAEVRWHTIVLDEAQAIKNHQTKRSQAAMALVGDFRMVCSGTPLENHLGELWNLFRFINPGLLGSLDHFNERYAIPIERQQDAVARSRLRKTIQPFILRRTKSQVLAELPSRTEILHRIDLTEQEAALYEALRREAL
ncbi:MAG TPA: SNF2-related protein, partial [Rhodocyclaceae bacterium]|nr:SNF2-related protein [Rhodocyclaceae bacterium]